MQDVKEIHFICFNDEVCYGPDEGQTNITPEMRIRWKRVFDKIEEILKTNGFTSDNTTGNRNDCDLIVALEKPFSFENALELLKQLESIYKVTQFKIDTEYDDWYDTNPHVEYCFYEI